jgi:hypothetical protein
MAETKRMTTEQVVGYLLEGEGLDLLRESLCWVVQQVVAVTQGTADEGGGGQECERSEDSGEAESANRRPDFSLARSELPRAEASLAFVMGWTAVIVDLPLRRRDVRARAASVNRERSLRASGGTP